ncbi:MAG: hypothetical protein B7Z40_08550 [Bosea sp. 12-68-7]|nr:MAG: hypothetical protein B7Z40_08550 [Bosea sp. 12-68-7]
MMGGLHLAAAAMLVNAMPRYEERTFVDGRQVISRVEPTLQYQGGDAAEAARRTAERAARAAEWERLRAHRKEQGEAAKVAAEDKRRRKNARRLGLRREIAGEGRES